MIALVAALPDIASQTLKKALISLYSFQGTEELFDGNEIFTLNYGKKQLNLYTLQKKALFYNHLDKQINAKMFAFLSKHVAKSNIPAYTCHTLGNWSPDATYGGYPQKVSVASPSLMRAMLRSLQKYCKNTGRDIVHEVTHHGPYLDTPSIYVEIGSTEMEWQETESGERVAKAIMDVLAKPIEPCIAAIGIGGLHTAPIFSKLTLTTKLGFAHMIPKHMLQHLTLELLQNAIRQSTEPIKYLVLDWKGLTPHKEQVKSICEASGLPIIRSDQVSKYDVIVETL